jgi:transposase
MPAPYSIDLRLRVIAACKRGVFTELELAETFAIGEATVRRWKRRERETGSVEPLPHGGGGTPLIDGEDLHLLRQIVHRKSDLTAQEIRDAFVEGAGIEVSRSATVRALARLGLTRKKRR